MTVVMETYIKGVRDGKSEGIALGEKRGAIWGRKEGIDLGRKEGISLGRKEAIVAIISLMQQNGFSMEDICKNTGLTEKEIERLITEKKK